MSLLTTLGRHWTIAPMTVMGDTVQGASSEGADSELLKLGYEACVAELKRQDTSLGNIRTRASGILGVTSLATTLGSSLGFFGADPTKGATWATGPAIILLALVVASGLCVCVIAFPVPDWSFGINGANLAQIGDVDAARRQAIAGMAEAIGNNESAYKLRVWVFQFLLLLFVVNIVYVAVTLTVARDWGLNL